ncbi:hypothetical protein [Pseudomonas sp. H3(2019)]|uniref:hypothetical protein n=1 Tax=Pseudomonas sp. H3(2019) TaxID=2598724 RepID=UPI00118EBF52|nr:hypothetical protein [Pseudomonas sp. H3(2019)]TVT80179.1 hypothetical protein FPT12_24030 [Pseudomonas sp. H3(2019)]
MLRKVSNKLFIWAAMALSTTLLVGCATSRYDGKREPDPSKAIILGSITEGFLTQPHGLVVEIRKHGEPNSILQLYTLQNEDDQPSPNLLGNLFMYEVSPGEYEFTSWSYQYYAGRAMARTAPVVFTVKAGEIAYIGDLYANAISFCLSNVNNDDKTLGNLKRKYPILNDRKILNLTAKSGFEPWPSSDATDNGKGLCRY